MTSKVSKLRPLAVSALALTLSGCVTAEQALQYSTHDAGFATVASTTAAATKGKETVWIQNQHQAKAMSERVHALVHKKTISADTAVQVALLNNRGLQAAYADLGMSAAEAWQQTMLENPTVSVGVLGIANPEVGAFRAIEGMIANNILALATQKRRVDIADTRFRQAQLKAAVETLRVAGDARKAWINAVSAFEAITYLNQAKVAADAASELAQKLGQSGAMPKAGQAREHAFYAELTGQTAEAVLASKLAKEELTRIMGLWASEVDYYVPNKLPQLPKSPVKKNALESEALKQSVDLQVAKLELEAVAKSYGLTEATRFVTDLEIIGGFEAEREVETELEIVGGELEETKVKKTVTTPQIELELVIPIFDSGKARMRKAELAYMQAANLLAEKAVNVRSEARSAYTAYRSTYDIARHYRNSVLPLRSKVEEESLLTYNGMITNTFELLADTRAKINTLLLANNAKREFWLAEANLTSAIFGGGIGSGGAGGGVPAVADAGGGPH